MMKNLRRMTAGIAAVTMLFCTAGNFPAVQNPAVTTRAEYEAAADWQIITETGNWGDNLTWTLVTDLRDTMNITSVLTISGKGEMTGEPEYLEYGINNFDSYVRSSVTKVIIEPGITNIDENAFVGFTQMQEIEIPDKVTTIGTNAFGCSPQNSLYFCGHLTSVTIPDGVTALGDYAFYSCTSLTDVTIPESVTEFGRDVFKGTKWANTIRETSSFIVNNVFLGFKSGAYFPYAVPDGVKTIAGGSLDATTNLVGIGNLGKYEQQVIIPESVTKIDDYAFWSELTEAAKEGITLYGVPGFYAETWAAEHEVTFQDVKTVSVTKQTIAGDATGDGVVSVSDVILLQRWLHAVPDTPFINWKNADLNQDDTLNIFDLILLKRMLIGKAETPAKNTRFNNLKLFFLLLFVV